MQEINVFSCNFSRGDYKKFLKLVVIYLGDVLSDGIRFRRPEVQYHIIWSDGRQNIYFAKKLYCFITNLN